MRIRILCLFLAALSAGAQPAATVWSTYHDAAGMTKELTRLAQTHPQLAKFESLGKSVQGRDIWLLTIARNGGQSKPAVLFDGAMHGSEVIGSESVLAYARYLLEHYDSDPGAKR